MNREGEKNMKKIIPFKKDIIFKTNVSEITSISLEHTLHIENYNVMGEFIVSGEYKITDTSINVEPFSYNLPFDITLDEKYVIEKASTDINDFYYEIVNDNVLSVNIEVAIDQLEERLIPEPIEVKEEPTELIREEIEIPIQPIQENLGNDLEEVVEENTLKEENVIEIQPVIMETERCIEEEEPPRKIETTEEKIGSLFDHMDDSIETYQSYKVYIVREGDTLEAILEKYSMTKEEIEAYNDMKEIKIGDKIIIPCVN